MIIYLLIEDNAGKETTLYAFDSISFAKHHLNIIKDDYPNRVYRITTIELIKA